MTTNNEYSRLLFPSWNAFVRSRADFALFLTKISNQKHREILEHPYYPNPNNPNILKDHKPDAFTIYTESNH